MEKDIDRIPKNPETDIVVRIDDFGGRIGLTIREFVKSDRYTGFTKAGTRIPADQFKAFKAAINSINEEDLVAVAESEKQVILDKKTTEEKTEGSPENTENNQEDLKEVPKEQEI